MFGHSYALSCSQTSLQKRFCLPGKAELEGQVQKLEAQAASLEKRLLGAEDRGRELSLGLALEEVEARKAEQLACENARDTLSSQFQALKVRKTFYSFKSAVREREASKFGRYAFEGV